MRLWHLLVRQVYKSENPENLKILKILVQTTARRQQRADKAPNQRQIRVWYLCLHCRRETCLSDLLLVSKTPPTSIYGTKLTSMVSAPNQIVSLIVKSTII